MNDILTNGAEIKQRIISEINAAKESIYLAMAWFTDRDIANAIIEAKNRMLIIDIILSSNVSNETVKLMFKGADISVHAFETGDDRGIMHHKFCLIDNKISINGSYNYSYNASNNNVENIHVTDSPDTYKQLFFEFERLKYNIDHNIDVNSKIEKQKPIEMEQPKTNNIIDSFYQQLHNLVYSSVQVDTKEYQIKGYQSSKESHGSIQIFKTEFDNIKSQINAFSTDENLTHQKEVLTANITHAYEALKVNLNEEKKKKVDDELRKKELNIKQLEDKIDTLNQEKSTLESGNSNSGEKGLLQINNAIEKNHLEQRNIEQNFIVKPFWNVGNTLVFIGLCIFIFYLSVFFGSAFYKVFFEKDEMEKLASQGLINGVNPKLVEANAIVILYKTKGFLYGIIGMIFFVIPVIISNLKIIGSKNQRVNRNMFWVGIFVFDIVVSTMVAINVNRIECLKQPNTPRLEIYEVIFLGEFWLMFVFGMFPLLIIHYLIDFIGNAYKNSKKDLINAEKNKELQMLEKELIDLKFEKENLSKIVDIKLENIKNLKEEVTKLDFDFNENKRQIEDTYDSYNLQARSIFDDFNTRIKSGKIFTETVLYNVISYYKLGFIEYLPEYYATEEVALRVNQIEQIITN